MSSFKAAALALFFVSACAKSEPPAPAETPPAPPPPAASPAPAAVPAPTASAAPTADSDLPTEEDFEDEAEQKVTAVTLDAQLDALEKEIKAE